jgi:hypothetical protein
MDAQPGVELIALRQCPEAGERENKEKQQGANTEDAERLPGGLSFLAVCLEKPHDAVDVYRLVARPWRH